MRFRLSSVKPDMNKICENVNANLLKKFLRRKYLFFINITCVYVNMLYFKVNL